MENKEILENTGNEIKGLKIKRLGILIAIATAVISFFLIAGIYFTYDNYTKILNVSHEYITWNRKAEAMTNASDHLTEQVRIFAQTGNRIYLDNYFKEANETKRRDDSLNYIKKNFPDSDIYYSLERAMNASLEIMNTEYLSMRLKIESMNGNLNEYPKAIQDVVLS